jgi:hypothetical protein
MIRTSDDHAPIAPRAAETDDTELGFAAMRANAMRRIQALVDPATGWTDFNAHDPGVTLLEAMLWAACDLGYRSDLPGHWNQRVALGHPTHLPSERGAHAAADALLRRALDDFGRGLRALPVQPGAADDGAGAAIANRVRRRQLAELLERHRPALERLLQAPDAGTSVCAAVRGLSESRLGWTPGDDEILAEIADLAGDALAAGAYEDEHGDSLIWPPQRAQVMAHAPVTGEDHLALLANHLAALGAARGDPGLRERVRRAWALPGLAAGVCWDGRLAPSALPEFPAGTTLLLDLADPGDGQEVAQEQASVQAQALLVDAALAIHGEEERGGKRWYDHRSLKATAQPHRLLGHEVRLAAAGRCRVRVIGEVLLSPTVDSADARSRLFAALRDWLEHGEAAPAEAPSAFASGWIPGRGLNGSEVARFLRNQPGVEQVVSVLLSANGEAAGEHLALAPYTVPFLDRDQSGLSLSSAAEV